MSSMPKMIIQEFRCIVVSAMSKMHYCKSKSVERELQLDLTASDTELAPVRLCAMQCLAQSRRFHMLTELESEVIADN